MSLVGLQCMIVIFPVYTQLFVFHGTKSNAIVLVLIDNLILVKQGLSLHNVKCFVVKRHDEYLDK